MSSYSSLSNETRLVPIQAGADMLCEQIPLYLQFFGFRGATVEVLREISRNA